MWVHTGENQNVLVQSAIAIKLVYKWAVIFSVVTSRVRALGIAERIPLDRTIPRLVNLTFSPCYQAGKQQVGHTLLQTPG